MTLAVNIAQGGSNNVTFRNRIINGAMVINQRGFSGSVTTNQYTLDRWQAISPTDSGKFSVSQSSTTATGFSYSLLATSLTAYTVLTNDRFSLAQAIEGYNTADLSWGTANAQTVTLSFWVRSSLTGTFGGALQNSDGNRSYPFTFTISSANTFEYKTITVAGSTSGTWFTTNGVGMYVYFGLGVGATYSGTAGAWANADYRSATGATSLVSTNGATLYITGVQLEAGTTASPFEYRQYGTELLLCQRYYETTAYPDVTFTTAATRAGVCFTGGNNSSGFSFLVPKRSNSPTVTLYSRNNTSGAVSLVATGAEVTGTTASGICGTGFRCTQLGSAQTVSAGIETAWVASSEL
jgi:hypothetical protein